MLRNLICLRDVVEQNVTLIAGLNTFSFLYIKWVKSPTNVLLKIGSNPINVIDIG